MDDLEKYILEQAKIEVDYTRAWPNKLLAFYVAINFGLAGSLIVLAIQAKSLFQITFCWRTIITFFVTVFWFWTVSLLIRNHLSYLRYRNIQIKFQQDNFEKKQKDKFLLPKDWFKLNKISPCTRWRGWCFYLFTTVLVAALTIASIWGSR